MGADILNSLASKWDILILGLIKNIKKGEKINKICIIIYLLLQIGITKSPKLNTKIIYTQKGLIMITSKGSTMMVLKPFKKVPKWCY